MISQELKYIKEDMKFLHKKINDIQGMVVNNKKFYEDLVNEILTILKQMRVCDEQVQKFNKKPNKNDN